MKEHEARHETNQILVPVRSTSQRFRLQHEKKISTADGVFEHEKPQRGETPFKRLQCDQAFPAFQYLRHHVNVRHCVIRQVPINPDRLQRVSPAPAES